MPWWVFAFLAALAASATAILAKIGVKDVPSNLATAIRTAVVLVFAWGIALATGEGAALAGISARSLLFLGLSGVATGISWLAYFRALQLAPASRVAPIDKTSLALTIILAATVLGETITVPVAIGTGLILAGALATLPPRAGATAAPAGAAIDSPPDRAWIVFALVSALSAAATAILAKIGIEGIPSNLATAIRTVVVLIFALLIVGARGDHRQLHAIPRRSLVFIILSGGGTGLSWLAYYHALELAPASRVAPIDKASLAFTILLAALVLKERVTPRVGLGVALMVGGALLTLA